MTYKEIQELNAVEPFCFEDDTQEQWYKCGLVEGANVGYKQATDDFLKKVKTWFADIESETQILKPNVWYKDLEQFITEQKQ